MKATWGEISKLMYELLSLYLHGPDATSSTAVNPLTLQFVGPRRERLSRIFDQQRCKGIQHAQTIAHPLLVPTVIIGAFIKIDALEERKDIERVVLGTAIIVGPLVLAWFSRYVPGGPSSMHWYFNNILVFWISLFGATLFDDHSGPLVQAQLSGQHFQHAYAEPAAGFVYSWVVSIGGLGWIAGYSLIWPTHPLCLLFCVLAHLFWYSYPILALEQPYLRTQLAPQLFLVAAVDAFIILGRVRAEFKEKLLADSIESVRLAGWFEQRERKTVTSLMKHAFNAHLWLGADASSVLEDFSAEGQQHSSLQLLRGMWPTDRERLGHGPLYFQDLFSTEVEQERFKTAIDALLFQHSQVNEVENAGEEHVQLLTATLNIYDPSSMRTAQRDCDIFILRAAHEMFADRDVDVPLPGRSFLVGLRVGAVRALPEGAIANNDSGDDEEPMPLNPEQIEAALMSRFADKDEHIRQTSLSGCREKLQSELGSQESMPRSIATSAMVVEALQRGLISESNAHKLLVEQGRVEHWLIDPDQVDFGDGQQLGSGGFGSVTLGRYLGSPAAIKRALPSRSRSSSRSLQPQVVNELRMLRYIRHPNIACFYGAVLWEDPVCIALVLEFVDGPTMSDYVAKFFVGDAEPAWWPIHQILAGTCLALRYLHEGSVAVVHGDLKPQNIMIAFVGAKAMPHAKLVDLGLSCKREYGAVTQGHSFRWAAPEVVAGRDIPMRASDIYSFAYVIYFCLSGKKPWEGMERTEVKAAMQERHAPLDFNINDKNTDSRLALLEPMLDLSPKKRWRIQQVQQGLDSLALLECNAQGSVSLSL